MAYVKHNFQPMDILHASEMNEIDEQVYQNSVQSYAKIVTQAEYDALSEAEKNSNVVYYVSDAPFDSPNVVTLTRAEYDALSTADKMDGRFYYITDDEEVATSLVVQTNQNNPDTVPSSAVLYSQINDILSLVNSESGKISAIAQTYDNFVVDGTTYTNVAAKVGGFRFDSADNSNSISVVKLFSTSSTALWRYVTGVNASGALFVTYKRSGTWSSTGWHLIGAPKEGTASATTDTYGSVKLFNTADYPNRRVLSAYAGNNRRALPFLGWNGASYGVSIFDIITNNPVTNTAVTVTYQYEDV